MSVLDGSNGNVDTVYQSARIAVHSASGTDIPLMWAAMGASDFDRFWPAPHPDSLDALYARYRWLQRLDETLEINAIATANSTGTPFAWLKLSGIDTYNRKAEFAIYVHSLRGTRASLEAVAAGIELSMRRVEKLVAYSLPENWLALRTIARMGFQAEGVHRKEIIGHDGARCDVLRFGLLRDDWQQQPLRSTLLACVLTQMDAPHA